MKLLVLGLRYIQTCVCMCILVNESLTPLHKRHEFLSPWYSFNQFNVRSIRQSRSWHMYTYNVLAIYIIIHTCTLYIHVTYELYYENIIYTYTTFLVSYMYIYVYISKSAQEPISHHACVLIVVYCGQWET
jgi:hypothetical protein